MFIIFIGPPGSGKGTQAKRLAARLQVPHVSTGAMLRKLGQDDSLGGHVAELLAGGRLLPDDLVLRLVRQRLAEPDCQNGCLLDGFPRTLAQARALDRWLAERDQAMDRVLELQVNEPELVQRMLERAAQEGRTDDTPETMRRRFQVYRAETVPLLSYYEHRGLRQTIDGSGTPDEVFQRILRELDERRTASG